MAREHEEHEPLTPVASGEPLVLGMVYTTFVAPREARLSIGAAAFAAVVVDFMQERLVTLPAVVLSAPNDLFPLHCRYDVGDPPEFSDVEVVHRGAVLDAVVAAIEDRHRADRCVCVWFRSLNRGHEKLADQLHLPELVPDTVDCTVALHLPRRAVDLALTDTHSDHRPRPLRRVPQYLEIHGRLAPYAHDLKDTEIERVLRRRWSGGLRFGTSVD